MERIAVQALKLLPKNLISRVLGAASEVELPPPVQGRLNRLFAEMADIDLEEAERPPNAYGSLNAFFTRRLEEGSRPVESSQKGAVISPVDGLLSSFGPIVDNTLFQAKGRKYRLVDLVDSGRQRHVFEGGHYATLYLSPSDYHRIHSPTCGEIRHVSYIPGHLFPVNPFAVRNIDELFAVNERLISYIENPRIGRVGVVKVGATCVGRIGVSFHDLETNHRFRRRRELELAEAVDIEHGQELGIFNLGSTVILLIEHPEFVFEDSLQEGRHLAVGELLGGVG